MAFVSLRSLRGLLSQQLPRNGRTISSVGGPSGPKLSDHGPSQARGAIFVVAPIIFFNAGLAFYYDNKTSSSDDNEERMRSNQEKKLKYEEYVRQNPIILPGFQCG